MIIFCTMLYASVCTFLVVLPVVVISQMTRYPCNQVPCSPGQECRLIQPPFCHERPCSPVPRCIPRLPGLRTCIIGDPVLDIYYRPLSCFPGQNCPPTTTCNEEVMDVQTTCCWTPQGEVRSPPTRRPGGGRRPMPVPSVQLTTPCPL